MITTIQLHENVKNSLERMKTNNETYEQVIKKMIDKINTNKKKTEELMIEGYLEMAKESAKINKEWEGVDLDW